MDSFVESKNTESVSKGPKVQRSGVFIFLAFITGLTVMGIFGAVYYQNKTTIQGFKGAQVDITQVGTTTPTYTLTPTPTVSTPTPTHQVIQTTTYTAPVTTAPVATLDPCAFIACDITSKVSSQVVVTNYSEDPNFPGDFTFTFQNNSSYSVSQIYVRFVFTNTTTNQIIDTKYQTAYTQLNPGDTSQSTLDVTTSTYNFTNIKVSFSIYKIYGDKAH